MTKPIDIMTSLSGEPITAVEQWAYFRRPEIIALFETFVYGVRPYEHPDKLTFTQTFCAENWMESGATFKEIDINVNDHHFPIYVFVPEQVDGPAPAFTVIMNELRGMKYNFYKSLDYDHLPIRDIVKRGYAVAVMPTNAVSPDWWLNGEFKHGVFHAMQPNASQRTSRSWATISAWAFGASRVMDYLETDPQIDSRNVAVIGHSRDGKTALWTAATDIRFKLPISNDSGVGGAAYTRGKQGEHLVDISISDWFCENYYRYNSCEDMLPVDQHMLLATIAPRPMYIKDNIEDTWIDPDAEFLSAKLASVAYELYGLPGLIADEKPELNKPYHDGMIAYHVAPGGHQMTTADWHMYMDFADKHLKTPEFFNKALKIG